MEVQVDPFLWGVDDVITSLTRPGGPWSNEPEALVANLKAEEIDGESLLTMGHVLGEEELEQTLGIKRARQRLWLRQELVRLRATSARFREWHQSYTRDHARSLGAMLTDHSILDSPVSRPSNSPLMTRAPPQENGDGSTPIPGALTTARSISRVSVTRSEESPDIPRVSPQQNGDQNASIPIAVTAAPALSNMPVSRPDDSAEAARASLLSNNAPAPEPPWETGEIQTSTSMTEGIADPQANDLRVSSMDNMAPVSRELAIRVTPQPSTPKRKRIIPINVSQALTEKPSVPSGDITSGLSAWERSRKGAYIGGGSLTFRMVKNPSVSVSTQLLETEEGGFYVTPHRFIPPGRRLAVYQIIKQTMRANGRKEMLLKEGFTLSRSATPSEDSDREVDLDDLPELDEQTRKEMEEEERDMEAMRKAQQSLPLEEVAAILTSSIKDMTKTWQETKRPKLERKAYKMWHTAMGRGNARERFQKIYKAQQSVNACETRLKKLVAEIEAQIWHQEKEVRSQARSLEQTLQDKLKHSWTIDLFHSKTEPPHPEMLPKPPPPRKPRSVGSGEELLSSSDDEDGFIVPDDDLHPPDEDTMMIDSDSRAIEPIKTEDKMEDSDFVDLTRSGSAVVTNPVIELIDLTQTPGDTTQHQSARQSPQKGALPELGHPSAIETYNLADIAKGSKKQWGKANDRWRLVIYLLNKLSHDSRSFILDMVEKRTSDEVWEKLITYFITVADSKTMAEIEEYEVDFAGLSLSRIFLSFTRCRYVKSVRLVPLTDKLKNELLDSRSIFDEFCNFIQSVADLFPKDSQIYRPDQFDHELLAEGDDMDIDAEELSKDGQSLTPSRTRRAAPKEIVRNKEAVDMREHQNEKQRIQQTRREKLQATLATEGIMSQDKSRLIINDAKEENQGFIYIHEEIGKRIMDHQIEGVRFLWNQIVSDADLRQGCLLAHTMGLGKSMQVVTLLVAITEAYRSDDHSVRAQIPKDLQESRSLILCPPGLVENWMDEFLKWAPEGTLGPLVQLDADTKANERQAVVENWAETGGVLVIGYSMFRSITESNETVRKILESKPSVVVADEAHKLKNPDAKLTKACGNFITSTRIALTGSPLSNHVGEYYAMIDWVAPNFLGPIDEFREIYINPIKDMSFKGSTAYEKRKGLKMLQVLKETVAPKVNRATIKSCPGNPMPPKREYILFVAPTAMQRTLYNMYIDGLNRDYGSSKLHQAKVFSLVNNLGLICNHPRCFRDKVLTEKSNLEKGVADGGETVSDTCFPKSIISSALKETRSDKNMDPSLSMKAELLNIILDEARQAGDKVLIFSQSISTLNYLQQILEQAKRRVMRLDGSTKVADRQKMVKRFNETSLEVYLISTTAGGVGLNMQGANRVVVFDTKWNPVDDQQAVGRAYRMGQKKPVFVYHFFAAGTFEEDMHNMAVYKTQLADRVVDEKNPISWSDRHKALGHPLQETPKQSLDEFLGQDKVLDQLIRHKSSSVADGRAICSIVSTETFEEEDPEAQLTAEERREADDLVILNRLRFTDPEQYEKKMQENRRVNAVQHAPQQAIPELQYNHVYRPAESRHGASGPVAGTSSQSTGQPSENPSQANPTRDNVPQPNGMSHTSDNSPQLMASDSSFNGPTPFPMMGANTFFGKWQAAPPTPSDAQENPPQQVATLDIFSKPVSRAAMTAFRLAFLEAIKGLVSQNQSLNIAVEQDVNDVTNSIHQIHVDNGSGFLPDHQQWLALKNMLKHDRFVLAAVTGHFSPKFLALADKTELEGRIGTLNDMSVADFTEQLDKSGKKVPDPHNLMNIKRGSMMRSSQGPARQDIKVMREAADKRSRSSYASSSQP